MAVVQEVGCALQGRLDHLRVVDDPDGLVVDAQPPVQPDLEHVRRVVPARCAVAVVVHNCGTERDWDGKPGGNGTQSSPCWQLL